MSEISTLYDAWISKIETSLSSYTRIPDPYDPEANSTLLLTKGYGLGMGPATNVERFAAPKMSIRREFFVVLTNRITATESDSSGRGSLEKSLMEDHYTLVKAIEGEPTLNGAAQVSRYVSDGGIEFLSGQRAKHFLLEIVFESEYFESTL